MTERKRPNDWTAAFITPAWDEDVTVSQPSPHLRREFDVPGEVGSARLYITAVGVYQAEINGQRVSEDVLRPGWTSYRRRLCYQTYDVTATVRSGANAICVILADGWARGQPRLSLIAPLFSHSAQQHL